MKRTLAAAGGPRRAVGEINLVVNACNICRDWHLPGPKAITTVRLVEEVNQEVQFDFLTYTSLTEPSEYVASSCI